MVEQIIIGTFYIRLKKIPM